MAKRNKKDMRHTIIARDDEMADKLYDFLDKQGVRYTTALDLLGIYFFIKDDHDYYRIEGSMINAGLGPMEGYIWKKVNYSTYSTVIAKLR